MHPELPRVRYLCSAAPVVFPCWERQIGSGGSQVEDRQGILADVTSKVAGLKTNVRKVEATSNEHHGRISMTMEISDLTHLRRIIKVIRGISGVLEVERLMR